MEAVRLPWALLPCLLHLSAAPASTRHSMKLLCVTLHEKYNSILSWSEVVLSMLSVHSTHALQVEVEETEEEKKKNAEAGAAAMRKFLSRCAARPIKYFRSGWLGT